MNYYFLKFFDFEPKCPKIGARTNFLMKSKKLTKKAKKEKRKKRVARQQIINKV